MKKIFLFVAILTLIIAGCNKTEISNIPETAEIGAHHLNISVFMPQETFTRTTVETAGLFNINVKWKVGDKITLIFKKDEQFEIVENVIITPSIEDPRKGSFDVTLPQGFNYPFDLYGVFAAKVVTEKGVLYADVSSREGSFPNFNIPMYFKIRDLHDDGNISVSFKHLGTMEVVTLKNNSNASYKVKRVIAQSVNGTIPSWFHTTNADTRPCFNLETETNISYLSFMAGTAPEMQTIEIPAGREHEFVRWMAPKNTHPSAIKVKVTSETGTEIESDIRPDRNAPLKTGYAYHLYLEYNGSELHFTPKPSSIILTTARTDNKLRLWLDAAIADRESVWLDANNNGIKEGEEGNITFSEYKEYVISSATVVLYGKLTDLICFQNELVSLNISKSNALNYLDCNGNQLSSLDVTRNTVLKELHCGGNQLTVLNVSSNEALTSLSCHMNQLTLLDVSQNRILKNLVCYNNQIKKVEMNALFDSLHGNLISDGKTIFAYENNSLETNEKPDNENITVAQNKGWTVKTSSL